MPKLVPTMADGVLSKWHVAEGDAINTGDLLCEIDVVGLSEDHRHSSTTMLIESHEDGYVARLFVAEGARVPVDHAIGVLVEEEGDVTAMAAFTPSPGPSPNSGAESKTAAGRLFCWQAYLKEE